jgi:hypothetical protein
MSIKFMKTGFCALSAACLATLVTGCSQPKTESIPTYQVLPAYQGAPAYKPSQTVNPTSTVQSVSPPAQTVAPRTEAQPVTAASPGTVAQTAPAPQAETIPSSPGPDYVWMPSYWTIGAGGGWAWVGGHYVLRQGVSEEQLRAARGMLEQSRAGLTGKALKNIDKAIDQINDALQVR